MEKRLTTAVFTVLSILLTATALASVFVYYPLTITVSPQAPGVIFQAGSNAGQADIGTNLITVNLGGNSTNATVKIHPTYQENYYRDVLRIVNNDNDAMRVYLIFDSPSNSLPQNSTVKLFVYNASTKVNELDITNPSTGTPTSLGTISAGETWQIDFYVRIPEGTYITGTEYVVTARLVYTPSAETPPVNPSSGR